MHGHVRVLHDSELAVRLGRADSYCPLPKAAVGSTWHNRFRLASAHQWVYGVVSWGTLLMFPAVMNSKHLSNLEAVVAAPRTTWQALH
jgi:hypothetical protein